MRWFVLTTMQIDVPTNEFLRGVFTDNPVTAFPFVLFFVNAADIVKALDEVD